MNPSNDQQPPVLSIVICTYNRCRLLQRCIECLAPQAQAIGAEIIVVNDGSVDATADVIEQFRSVVTCAGWVENRGLNAARNEGIRLSKAPVVLFFDDDQLPPDGYLERILAALRDEVDGVGGPIRDAGGGLRTCDRCGALGDATLGDIARESPRLIGGNMALRKRSFEVAGLFDERLSGRGDETEWFRRAEGLRFAYDPELWVWHRRDTFSWFELFRYAFRQGKAMPVFDSITGVESSRRVRRALRHSAHAVLRRCSHGAELAFREFGALASRPARTGGRA